MMISPEIPALSISALQDLTHLGSSSGWLWVKMQTDKSITHHRLCWLGVSIEFEGKRTFSSKFQPFQSTSPVPLQCPRLVRSSLGHAILRHISSMFQTRQSSKTSRARDFKPI